MTRGSYILTIFAKHGDPDPETEDIRRALKYKHSAVAAVFDIDAAGSDSMAFRRRALRNVFCDLDSQFLVPH